MSESKNWYIYKIEYYAAERMKFYISNKRHPPDADLGPQLHMK